MTSDTDNELESQVQRLARNGLALVAGGVVAQLTFAFLEILVARKLGAELYGVFVTAYSWTVLGTCLIEFGTSLWTVQQGSRRHVRLPLLLGAGLTVNLVMFAFLYSLLAVVVVSLAPGPVLGFMLILFPYGLILALQNQFAAVFASYQTMHVNAFFQGLSPLVILGFFLVYSARDLALSDVGYAYVIGGAVISGMWFAYTLRRLRPRFSAPHVFSTLRSSYPYALSNILGQVHFKTDVVMLAALGGVREAGIYAVAAKLIDLVSKVALLFSRVFAPAIFKASHQSDGSFAVFAGMMTRVLAVTGLLAGIVAFVLAEDIIRLLFGENYGGSASILRILAGVMATRCMMAALQLLLSSIDLNLERVAGLGIAITGHIAANAILIPRFGAAGAATATLLSGLLIVLVYAWSASRNRTFHFIRWLLLPACAAAAISGLAYVSGLHPLLQATAAAATFLAVLFVSGFVRGHEVSFLMRAIQDGGSGQDVRNDRH